MKLLRFVASTLIAILGSVSCYTPAHVTYLYGTQLDSPGPAAVLWPADSTGNSWHTVSMANSGYSDATNVESRNCAAEQVLVAEKDHDYSSIIVVLPPTSSSSLAVATAHLSTRLADEHPRASVILLRPGFEPFGVENLSELLMRLAQPSQKQAYIRKESFMFAEGVPLFLFDPQIAEIGIMPLAGGEVRFAVFTLATGKSDGLNVREAVASNLTEVMQALLRDTRSEWRESDNEAERQTVKTGSVRALVPMGTSHEARMVLDGVLTEIGAKDGFAPVGYGTQFGLTGRLLPRHAVEVVYLGPDPTLAIDSIEDLRNDMDPWFWLAGW